MTLTTFKDRLNDFVLKADENDLSANSVRDGVAVIMKTFGGEKLEVCAYAPISCGCSVLQDETVDAKTLADFKESLEYRDEDDLIQLVDELLWYYIPQ